MLHILNAYPCSMNQSRLAWRHGSSLLKLVHGITPARADDAMLYTDLQGYRCELSVTCPPFSVPLLKSTKTTACHFRNAKTVGSESSNVALPQNVYKQGTSQPPWGDQNTVLPPLIALFASSNVTSRDLSWYMTNSFVTCHYSNCMLDIMVHKGRELVTSSSMKVSK